MSQGNYSKAVLFIILASLFSALMGIIVNLTGNIPSMQKSFMRNMVACLIAFIVHKRSGKSFCINMKLAPSLAIRCAAGTIGLMASFYSLDRLAVADWTMIGKLAPFFTLIFSSLILNERVTPKQKKLMVLAIAGSIFIVKPSFSNTGLFPGLICFSDAVLSGIAYTYVRRLGIAGMPSSLIVFYFSLCATIATSIFVLICFVPMTFTQTALLICAAVCGFFAQIFLTKAYSLSPAREISIFEYSQVVFAAVLGFFFLHQVPDLLSMIGYIIIFVASTKMYVKK